MRVIVIAAGRGRRLMPTTADAPKCFAEVAGKRLIDWAVEAFQANGIDRICFIGGYQIDRVKEGIHEVIVYCKEHKDKKVIQAIDVILKSKKD